MCENEVTRGWDNDDTVLKFLISYGFVKNNYETIGFRISQFSELSAENDVIHSF